MFTYRRGNDLINKKILEKKIKRFSSVMCLVLIMTNVTGCRASKVADMFGTSVESASADKDGSTDDLSDTAGTEMAANSIEAEESGVDSTGKEPETETEPEPIPQTVTISATGDCTLGKTQQHGYEGSFYSYYDKYGEDYFFSGVKDIFENDDFTLVNLECVLTTSTDRVEKTYNLKGEPEYAGILPASSIEGCSLGNNHTYDYGEKSHTDTENALNEVGVDFAFQDHLGTYTTDEGVVIGFVSANLLSMSSTYEDYLYNGIAELKEQGADVIIACCHWGIERTYYPNDYQQNLAHGLIDTGADLVIGNHPHVLQGVEVYNGKVICYSLGNFCFGANRNPNDKDTMIFQQTFTFVDGEMQSDIDADIIPCTLSSTDSYNDFKPTVAAGSRKQTIIDNMNTYSAPYSEISFDSEGKLIYTLP